jgi:hypothetical protein
MKSFKKRQAFSWLGKASMELVEFLSEGDQLDIDEQRFIENHILLMQLEYCNWKYGPPKQSKQEEASQHAA